MHRDSRQRKVASYTTTFGQVWPYVSLIRSDCRNLWKESIDVLEFLHRYDHQGKVASEYYFGWVWQVIPLVWSNCWILWYINISGKNHFLHENKHQGKVVSETITFGWIWPIVPLVQSDCWILWSTLSLEGIYWCVLHGDIYQGKVAPHLRPSHFIEWG